MGGGSSLWLVPPEDSALYRTCHRLITSQIPSLFSSSPASPPPPPVFTPHVTLTADTVPSDLVPEQQEGQKLRESPPSSSSTTPPGNRSPSAQKWLDGLVLRPPLTRNVRVVIQQVQVEGPFFRKLTLQCEKCAPLCELAGTCRARGLEGLDGGEQRDGEAGKWVGEFYRPHLSLM